MVADTVHTTPLTIKSQAARRGPAPLDLLVAPGAPEHKTQKIEVAAALANIKLRITAAKDDSELTKLCPHAATVVLTTRNGPVTRSDAVLKYVSGLNPATELCGADGFGRGRVDQWLEFGTHELEVAVVAATTHAKNKDVVGRATKDVQQACRTLDAALQKTTYLAGDRVSAADCAVVCVLRAALKGNLIATAKLGPSLLRWYLTCLHAPAFSSILGADAKNDALKALPAGKAPASKKPAAAKAKASPVAKKAVADPRTLFTPTFARSRERLKELLGRGAQAVGATVVVAGWVRTLREAMKGATLFVELNDGSCLASIQVVCGSDSTEGFAAAKACGGAGASLRVEGAVVESPGKGQTIEILAKAITVLGCTRGGPGRTVGAQTYPLAKKYHTLEHLRTHAHLRPRSRVGSAVVRLRNALAFATHEFFQQRGFLYVHTPLITAADCEGAGEQFTVTTLLPPEHDKAPKLPTVDGRVDYSKDFFGRQASLTVSGQLNVETHAVSLADCYTFGPTFRAENSNTSRHLAEFWMIEPEVSFATLADDIALAEDYLKYCVAAALCRCADDLEFFEGSKNEGLRDRLKAIVETPFKRLEYTEAISVLQKEMKAGRAKFENTDVTWGIDLDSEHERYLTEKVYKGPVVLINYPKDIKAFYMKLNADGKTVAAMDILVPRIGEIIGGSQREDSLEVLEERAKSVGLNPEDIKWYGELRQYGSVPHAGFGLGFERLVMLCSGVENIRDVIPFPRTPGNCRF